MTAANEMQVGGTHYKTKFEHWDLVLVTGMGYFEGNATKYISRWKKKGGIADLKKALHYMDKLIENAPPYRSADSEQFAAIGEEVSKFSKINQLGPLEDVLIYELAAWTDRQRHLVVARAKLQEFILGEERLGKLAASVLGSDAEPEPVRLTEENHHAERRDEVGWPPAICMAAQLTRITVKDPNGNLPTYKCAYPDCNCKRDDPPK